MGVMPSRRRVLRRALPAVLAGAAGCQFRGETDIPRTDTLFDTPATRTATPSPRTATGSDAHPPGTRVVLDGGSVGLRVLRVRATTTYPGRYLRRLAAGPGRQYLVATVDPFDAGDGDPTPYERFSLVLDGSEHEPGVAAWNGRVPPLVRERVLFSLPADLSPDRGRLRWTGPDGRTVEWRVPEARLRELSLSPSFSVERVDVLDVRRRSGSEAVVEPLVRAHNDGERDGNFVCLVSYPTDDDVVDLNPSTVVDFPVRRDGAATWTRPVEWPAPPTGEVTVSFGWRGGGDDVSVTVPSEEEG